MGARLCCHLKIHLPSTWYMSRGLSSWEFAHLERDGSTVKAEILFQIVGKEMAWAGIDWHPEGLDLAAAGPANDIILYERHNWQTISHLDGEHTASISCLLFSPNGMWYTICSYVQSFWKA